jgi:hypothetical protein
MRLIMGAHERDVWGKRVLPGEEFEVPDTEARTWIKLGWAREATMRPAKRYSRADMRAEEK